MFLERRLEGSNCFRILAEVGQRLIEEAVLGPTCAADIPRSAEWCFAAALVFCEVTKDSSDGLVQPGGQGDVQTCSSDFPKHSCPPCSTRDEGMGTV